MTNNITINSKNNTIEITKKFAAACRFPRFDCFCFVEQFVSMFVS